jgi:tight adherence protein C
MSQFYFFRLVLPLAFGALAGLFVFLAPGVRLQLPFRLAAVLVSVMAGFHAPNLYITNAAKKRQLSIARAFPDALDLLLICVEAGMSIEAALGKVGREMGVASAALAEELTLLVAELSYLPERRLAYIAFTKRNNKNPGVKSVMTAMIQAERYGTNLGAALRATANENRDLRLAAAEKKAAALPAKLTVPMIGLFLPVLFICILGPAIINVSKSMSHGPATGF